MFLGGTAASRLVLPSSTHAGPRAAPTRTATEATLATVAGIPQEGATLGDPRAPVTLIEFADLQCPYCAFVGTELLPPLVDQYVRTGRVKLVYRPLAFVGKDSEREARVAVAMGQQNELWQFVELAFREQGRENSGYATDAYLKKLVASVPGADVSKAMADRDSPAVERLLAGASAEAERLGVHGTPAFFIAGPGKAPHPIAVQSLVPSEFARVVDAESHPAPATATAGRLHGGDEARASSAAAGA